jgi:hypothetical protein
LCGFKKSDGFGLTKTFFCSTPNIDILPHLILKEVFMRIPPGIKIIGLLISALLCFVPFAFGSQTLQLESFSTLGEGNSFLEREAGISAYAQVSSISSVQLDNAEEALSVVEVRADDYVIGSVSLENYHKEYDAHIYVDTAGWVVAYYSRNAHASKIIDFVGFSETGQLTTSTLEMALDIVCEAMFVTTSNVKYYDFRYPQATRIVVAVDQEDRHKETSSFNINTPKSLNVYERSWSHRVQVFHYPRDIHSSEDYPEYLKGNVKIDDIVLHEFDSLPPLSENDPPWYSWEGSMTGHQLYPDRYCTMSVYNYNHYYASRRYATSTNYVGICIIYSE